MTTANININEESRATRMPTFQKMREGLHVSYSQVTQYMICPLKFQFQYVQGLQPEFIGAALPFGSAIHHTIAVLYKQLQATDKAPSKSEVQSVFADRWEWQQKNENGVEVKFKDGKESWDSLKDITAPPRAFRTATPTFARAGGKVYQSADVDLLNTLISKPHGSTIHHCIKEHREIGWTKDCLSGGSL